MRNSRHILFLSMLIWSMLFAQHGAYLHVLSHLSERENATAQVSKPAKSEATHFAYCVQCLAYAAIGGIVSNTSLLLLAFCGAFFFLVSVFTVVRTRAWRVYNSRAPPISLVTYDS